jgi:hypothetical protein
MLPALKSSTRYGGVMLWSRFYDDQLDGYSKAIKNSRLILICMQASILCGECFIFGYVNCPHILKISA